MRRALSIGVAAGSVLVLVLAVAAPAHADTVTTSTVVATTAGDITNPPFTSSLPALLPAGPVAFPVTVDGTASAPGATLSPGLPGAGCSRVVNSFTLAFSAPFLLGVAGVQVANFVSGSLVDSSNFTYSGAGSVSQGGGVIAVAFPLSPTPQSGLLSFVYPTPVAIADLYQLVAFLQPGTWSIDSATFSVTDTCADAAAAAAGGPTLAASGVDVMPLGVIAVALLVGGLGLRALGVRALGVRALGVRALGVRRPEIGALRTSRRSRSA